MSKVFCRIFVVLLAAFLFGCNSKQVSIKDYYYLETARDMPQRGKAHNTTILVERFAVAEAFASSSLIYRNQKGLFEPDYYRRFIADKGALLGDITSQWLAESGLFDDVLPAKASVRSDYRLKGFINEFYADMQEPESQEAILRVSIFIVDKSGVPVFSSRYKVSAVIESDTAEAVIAAKNECVYKYLAALEKDLAGAELKP